MKKGHSLLTERFNYVSIKVYSEFVFRFFNGRLWTEPEKFLSTPRAAI